MRLNKKLFKPFVRTGYNQEGKTEYVDMEKVGGFLLIVAGLITAAFLAFFAITALVPSEKEVKHYEDRCNIIAAEKRHYTTENRQHEKVCVIGDDWHQVVI